MFKVNIPEHDLKYLIYLRSNTQDKKLTIFPILHYCCISQGKNHFSFKNKIPLHKTRTPFNL